MEAIERAAAALRDARFVAVLTGAGVSAESGVPTFRDAQTGLWAKYDPRELATPEAFARNPKLVWDWYAERRAMISKVDPNAAHTALVEIESRVPGFLLATQNVDGLHRRAGSRKLVELHGNIVRVRCSGCGVHARVWSDESPPRCEAATRSCARTSCGSTSSCRKMPRVPPRTPPSVATCTRRRHVGRGVSGRGAPVRRAAQRRARHRGQSRRDAAHILGNVRVARQGGRRAAALVRAAFAA